MQTHEITRRRTALGLTMAQLARELGVDRATVHRWETGAAATALDVTFKRLERNAANRARRQHRAVARRLDR
jgi:transcriptional regulator with XRE-family HTH domain